MTVTTATSTSGQHTSYPSIAGRIALVIGGSRGIGAAIVSHLYRSQARVAFTYKADVEAASVLVSSLQGSDKDLIPIQADSCNSRKEAGVLDSVIEHVENTLGTIDFLILNAAHVEAVNTLEATDEQIDQCFDANIRAAVRLCGLTVPKMKPGGRVIFLSSALTQATSIFDDRFALYAASKGGIEQLTRYLSKTFGPKQITVNTVSPGPTDTDGLRSDGLSSQAVEEKLKRMAAMTPLGRVGHVNDIARLILFLLSADGGFISGQTINSNGGFSV